MSERDDATTGDLHGAETGLTVSDLAHSPFIYFENATALSHINGLIRITISAEAQIVDAGRVSGHEVVVAYLRTNVHGAMSLRDALDKAILLGTPTQQPSGKVS